jgi:hypothetical protein
MAQTGEAFENAGAYSLAWLPSPSPGHFAATPAAKDFLEWLKGLRTYQNSAGGFLAKWRAPRDLRSIAKP